MEKLIRRCQQGDRESMGQLYTVMHDELLIQCRKYAANDNIAEDLLHDAFLLIFSNINQLRSPEKGVRWMRKVVRNVCLLYVQHRVNRAFISIEDMPEATEGTDLNTTLTYDDILSAIDQLPRGYRQVFRLSVLDGMTHQQIAELLGIEPHSSSSQLLRARRQLRQMLQVLMFILLAAIPFVSYYFWSLQNRKHDLAKDSEDKPIEIRDITKENPEDVHAKETTPFQTTITDTTIRKPLKQIAKKNHAANKQKQSTVYLDSVECEQAQLTTQAEENKVQDHNVEMEENSNRVTIPQNQIDLPSPSTSHSNLFLSIAYNGLPNGSARQLPYGAEGMNGEIDSVTHHRLPISVAMNARYSLGSRWWLDGGLRYTQLSSETRVGNTYIFMEQQQRVRYLGLSVGVGYQLWHHQPWNLYTTTSVSYELPLRSISDVSYWLDGRLIDTEKIRLTPHPQWSVGIGAGLQYDLTPNIGFFAEPNLQYYFHNSDGIKTWRTEHPFTPMLPFGIRISF